MKTLQILLILPLTAFAWEANFYGSNETITATGVTLKCANMPWRGVDHNVDAVEFISSFSYPDQPKEYQYQRAYNLAYFSSKGCKGTVFGSLNGDKNDITKVLSQDGVGHSVESFFVSTTNLAN